MKNSTNMFFAMILFFSSIYSTISICQSSDPFVASNFDVPELLETDKFRLRMLTVNDVVKDYDAVITSVDYLKGVFGPQSKWPSKQLTFEQDLIDLGWHQKEFQRRSYIDPTDKIGYDAEVYLWVRESEFKNGLDPILFDAVKKWIEKEWPFKNVAYPGREIEWTKWEAMSE
jgi:hypothetical protein